MRKIALSFIVVILASCSATSPKKAAVKKPLFEILTQQSHGGASFRFYEIITDSKEIKMLQLDENLKDKISPEDGVTSNFIILNMGEKNSGGYSITVDQVEETPSKIIVTVKEQEPKTGEMVTTVMTNPYCVVKINSKKEIEIK